MSKQTIYRKVQVSEELPDKNGLYFTIRGEWQMANWFIDGEWIGTEDVDYWLKEETVHVLDHDEFVNVLSALIQLKSSYSDEFTPLENLMYQTAINILCKE